MSSRPFLPEMTHYIGQTTTERFSNFGFRRGAGFRPFHKVGAAFDTFFQAKATGLSPAQTLGAPLIPIGVGVAALAVLIKAPKFAPIGIAMSAAGIVLLAIARKKQDDTLAQQGIVSGDFPQGNPHPGWIYDQNSYGWIPG